MTKDRKKMIERGGDSICEAVLEEMGYISSDRCCENCAHFQGSEGYGGERHARPARCTFNAAFDLQVEEAGMCDHWETPANSQEPK